MTSIVTAGRRSTTAREYIDVVSFLLTLKGEGAQAAAKK